MHELCTTIGAVLPPVCPRCLEAGGLCIGCANGDRSILPQLAQPHWLRQLMAKTGPPKAPPQDPAVARAERRNERKRRKARTINRFQRALRGEFTRSRPASRSAT